MPTVHYGIALEAETITSYAIREGLWDPNKPDKYAEPYVDDEKPIPVGYCRGMYEARERLARIAFEDNYPSVHWTMPYHPKIGYILSFYSNFTPEGKRYTQNVEEQVLAVLREALQLTPKQARPRWYYQYDEYYY